MLKKGNRLQGRENFVEMRKKGRLVQSPLFGLVYLEGEGKRCGVVVSKKISKLAVERNKIRRRIYEVLNKNWEKVVDDKWLLFLVKKEILEEETKEIEKEMLKCLGKIR